LRMVVHWPDQISCSAGGPAGWRVRVLICSDAECHCTHKPSNNHYYLHLLQAVRDIKILLESDWRGGEEKCAHRKGHIPNERAKQRHHNQALRRWQEVALHNTQPQRASPFRALKSFSDVARLAEKRCVALKSFGRLA